MTRLIILSLLLAGCAPRWKIPQGQEDAYKRAHFACYQELANRTARINKGAFLNSCMAAKGWEK